MSLLAYANPPDIKDEHQRADGYGIVRFDKQNRKITFECWPRFSDAKQGDKAQFPGWPITVSIEDNDGRKPIGYLPTLVFEGAKNPVVQVIEDATGEIVYTIRVRGERFQPRVYKAGKYIVKIGRDKPSETTIKELAAVEGAGQREIVVKLQ